MIPFGLSAYRLAELCLIPRTRIERIAREETGITTDTALRLAEYFGTTPQFWVRLQERFDLETKRTEIAAELRKIKTGSLETA